MKQGEYVPQNTQIGKSLAYPKTHRLARVWRTPKHADWQEFDVPQNMYIGKKHHPQSGNELIHKAETNAMSV